MMGFRDSFDCFACRKSPDHDSAIRASSDDHIIGGIEFYRFRYVQQGAGAEDAGF